MAAAINMVQQPQVLTESQSRRFQDVEEKQNQFHEWLRTTNLAPEAARAISCRTHADVVQFWTSISGAAQSRYNAQREKGWRLWSKRYQTFSGGVISFMKDMEPVLDIVKGFGAPYSGIAVGTITVLFMFAGRKNALEGRISSALEGVRDRLPGFKMYEYIYRADNVLETELRKKILLAYLAFIELSIEISKYYFRPAIYRWMIASFKSTKFDDMAETVFDLVVAVRMSCEELLSLNVSEIKEQNRELLRDKNISQLIEVQKLLGLESWTSEAHKSALLQYRSGLNAECAEEVNYERMSSNSKLWNNPISDEWKKTDQSRLLLLIGVNNENISQGKRYNWISPFVLELADRLAREGGMETLAAVYVFNPVSRSRSSIHTAIPVVLLQLLQYRQRVLGGGFPTHREDLMASLHKFAAAKTSEDEEDDEGDKIDALKELAAHVLNLFDSKATVYIVLDRVDMCRDQDHYELIHTLATVMQRARCVVKVLAVADPVGWTVNMKSLGLPNASQLAVLELRQRMLYDSGY